MIGIFASCLQILLQKYLITIYYIFKVLALTFSIEKEKHISRNFIIQIKFCPEMYYSFIQFITNGVNNTSVTHVSSFINTKAYYTCKKNTVKLFALCIEKDQCFIIKHWSFVALKKLF
jgi:hypothetical protein